MNERDLARFPALTKAALVAKPKSHRRTATTLLRVLSAALAAFDDEEDSVKEEHAALIRRIRSTVAQAEKDLAP